MYLDRPGEMFAAGHAAAGVTALATNWVLAEGATGEFFDDYVLIANPGDQAANVEATFAKPDGTTVVRSYAVAPRSRFTILVDEQDPRLSSTAVSTRIAVTNGVPIAVERVMWWPGPGAATWYEAHVSAGVTAPAQRWAVAEGEAGGAARTATYLLVANTSTVAGAVRVTIVTEQGTVASRTFGLAANARLTVDVAHEFPAVIGSRFGATVESIAPGFVPIVVEWAMYSSADGRYWSGGSGAVATPLP
jgi:hypothetical protein